MQKRRSGTEARIAIFKNNGGRVWRAKGCRNRSLAVAYGALTHNLRWLAQSILAMEESGEKQRLAASEEEICPGLLEGEVRPGKPCYA